MSVNQSSKSLSSLTDTPMGSMLSSMFNWADFNLVIQNFANLTETFGSAAADEAVSVLLAKIQIEIDDRGVASIKSKDVITILLWNDDTPTNFGKARAAQAWLDTLAIRMAYEPILTSAGAVHLYATVTPSGKVAEGREKPETTNAVQGMKNAPRIYRKKNPVSADMEALSPVLAAIGGFPAPGDIVDVDLCWRPVRSLTADNVVTYFEARLELMTSGGERKSGHEVTAAADRLNLSSLLDQYLVFSVIEELEKSDGSIVLAASVSASSLAHDHFWRAAFRKFERSPHLARNLILEVRAGGNASSAFGLTEAVLRLKQLGCRISIANFGLGDGSLRLTVACAPAYVVIDRHFATAVGRGKFSAAVLEHLVGLAGAFGAQPVIDGVDTAEVALTLEGMKGVSYKGDWCGKSRFSRPWTQSSFDRDEIRSF